MIQQYSTSAYRARGTVELVRRRRRTLFAELVASEEPRSEPRDYQM